MKRRERGKVEAKVEICWGSIKAWMKGGRRGEEGGRSEEGSRSVAVYKVAAQREGGVKR